MNIISTPISDLKILKPQIFGDERGFFMETFRDAWFREHVADVSFVQENQSLSKYGTLRGMHYQTQQAQGKLIRVISGEVFDVVIDLRRSSSSFGQWFATQLSAENRLQLWVPPGFAHGFYVASSSAEVIYKCTDYYAPQFEQSILWHDTDLAIDWPISVEDTPQLSEKDRNGVKFKNALFFE
ncbi:dTDP-4-dehydrorhamnose 3,5-epimerase [Shewanella sp. D64]|uniref:dTDP-4-dehydrorhamnose 3,5-epimerase n=1 Tax=unclassified Shewanella TaxID=196818 RepID=UPI0022BA5330|nr:MULTISPECIES: dTDP-4-dehydrorhamnose 3,5-epimerase [unclassified Shewanella]MEC4727751.1 dTDP-4-dehydrorhamnose 3,5-epimerase [Shewanella sp. D64]MEC4737514.1 dTDP-4-dehydrorhamnose 3,5-epimerase [Shewanella sp. E94]WBJ97323.1 dTDP-4-dehydrorhamnose 3,5-epimerase [Shewanella sp. MTB7]